jgi:hypothetical protein
MQLPCYDDACSCQQCYHLPYACAIANFWWSDVFLWVHLLGLMLLQLVRHLLVVSARQVRGGSDGIIISKVFEPLLSCAAAWFDRSCTGVSAKYTHFTLQNPSGIARNMSV